MHVWVGWIDTRRRDGYKRWREGRGKWSERSKEGRRREEASMVSESFTGVEMTVVIPHSLLHSISATVLPPFPSRLNPAVDIMVIWEVHELHPFPFPPSPPWEISLWSPVLVLLNFAPHSSSSFSSESFPYSVTIVILCHIIHQNIAHPLLLPISSPFLFSSFPFYLPLFRLLLPPSSRSFPPLELIERVSYPHPVPLSFFIVFHCRRPFNGQHKFPSHSSGILG